MLRYIPRYSRYYMDSTVETTVGSVGDGVVLCCAVLCCAVLYIDSILQTDRQPRLVGKCPEVWEEKSRRSPCPAYPFTPFTVNGQMDFTVVAE
jgi:hypothetical protein